MAETNKSLRIKTNINGDSFINVNLNQTYDTFEILSLKLRSEDVYRLHSANYGVIIGRVLANENFGVPNAKISIFIQSDFENDSDIISNLYPYSTTATKNNDNVRYNLLPNDKVSDCHQVVGTFPNKTYLLDNDTLIEVFDKYYVYTTRTNNAGDYIIAGVPVGQQTIHMDLDLSDCGILSQRPRDFVYKGYTIEQFENPNQFKTSTELDSLTQIFTQNQVVNVIPFWGNVDNGETIGITRADINISFKFEPTCVFIGSLVADNSSNGISKKCVPTNQMGAMDELTTGEGTIEMIRKTPGGNIEEFQVKGTELIDGNGIWCYQIPMNLDYMMTDEYGNMVPTDDPTKGVPTRTRVRFRISMEDNEANTDNYFRAKVLVPHNPLNLEGGGHEDYDYAFGSNTREDSFRDLFWNNVYTVKSYIPRFQKPKNNIRTERFTGIKHCNIYGQNNPMPYNNIRIKLPLMFTILCALIKTYIRIVYVANSLLVLLMSLLKPLLSTFSIIQKIVTSLFAKIGIRLVFQQPRFLTIGDGLCPDLENWYFAPTNKNFTMTVPGNNNDLDLLKSTFMALKSDSSEDAYPSDYKDVTDPKSIEDKNGDSGDTQNLCLTVNTDYLISCIEMALAQEYKVINFDFYNDWVNGVIYMPRWMRFVRKKRSFLWGLIKIKPKVKGCMDDTTIFHKTRYYVQQCALMYQKDNNGIYNTLANPNGCVSDTKNKQKCHKRHGRISYPIFGGDKKTGNGNGGVVHEHQTMLKENVYYFKPCEWGQNNRKVLLFANDLVLLGSLNDCSMYGIPQAFRYLKSSSYIMPTNLALTNMDEEGYLYATPDGTICNGSDESNNINYKKDDDIYRLDDKSVKEVSPSFVNEQKYYSGSTDPLSFGITPEGSDITDIFDDSIPLTEAAGISWNYTGPGQGEKSDNVNESLYMPGGHFLGISCFNAETNIKSCINLQRICEMGSTMSQRREEVREIIKKDEDGKEYEVSYRYYVPTGLISNDEINGDNFRTMFATMNSKRLLCEDEFIDEKTGYPFYRFNYLRNTGFGGEFKNKIETDSSDFNYWNKQLTIDDEYSTLNANGGNIAKDVNYDDNEINETFTRTWETANYDYYSFRFGLLNLSKEEQERHYLYWAGTDGGTSTNEYSGRRSSSGMYQNVNTNPQGKKVALPQYENSFYFYFGLRDGATALDEFNKQFFSVCDTEYVVEKSMTIAANPDFDECTMISSVVISGKDAVAPLSISHSHYNENGELITETIDNVEAKNGYYSVEFTNLERGTYTFTVIDADRNRAQRVVELGGNTDVDANIGTEGFSFKAEEGMSQGDISLCGQTHDCGYIAIENVSFNGNLITDTPFVTIVEKNENDEGVAYYTNANGMPLPPNIGTMASGIITATSIYDRYGDSVSEDTGQEGSLLIFVWKPNTKYDVYLYNNNCGASTYYYYGTYYVGGIEAIDLYLGNRQFAIPYGSKLQYLYQNDNPRWWLTIGEDGVENGIVPEVDNWYLRYFLMNRDVSGSSFTNNVFGMGENGSAINTALFGQPEKYNIGTESYYLINGVEYEDDHRLDGVVADTSYIPTWKIDSPENRKLFAEMAINGQNISSQPVVTIRTSDIVESYTSGNIHGWDVSDPNNMLPDSELEDYIVIPDSGDKYGYFIGKTDDGRIYYITLEYNGGSRIFTYEGNRFSGKVLTLYPVFYYPVMWKPFSAHMNVVDWLNPRLNASSEVDSIMTDFEVKYISETYVAGVTADNGLTYNKTYGEGSMLTHYGIKQGQDREHTIDITREEDDLSENASGQTAFLDNIHIYEEEVYFDFNISEGKPSTTPFEPNILTIGGNVTARTANYITYRKNEAGDRATYYQDIVDNDNKYYLVNGTVHPCPLVPSEYIYYPYILPHEVSTLRVLGRFGTGSDTALSVQKEPNTYVQQPSQFVVIDVTDNGYSFPYKVNSTTSESVTKTVTITDGHLINNTILFQSILQDSLRQFDITLEVGYDWNRQNEYTYVNEYAQTIKQCADDPHDNTVSRIPRFADASYSVPGPLDYVVCVVEGDNVTYIKIYPGLVNLDEYSSNSSTPYLYLIPAGMEGVYK